MPTHVAPADGNHERALGSRKVDFLREQFARLPTDRPSLYATLAEYLFILLPLVVLALVFWVTNDPDHDLLATPEWSFGAAILFGQAVQRVASASAKTRAYRWEKTTLLVSALLVLGLVPSLLTLALVIQTDTGAATDTLSNLQIGLFLAGSIAFVFFGSASHHLIFHPSKPERD